MIYILIGLYELMIFLILWKYLIKLICIINLFLLLINYFNIIYLIDVYINLIIDVLI